MFPTDSESDQNTARTLSGFPLYIPLGDAAKKLIQVKGSKEYTKRLLDLLVRDTPFRVQDIREIQEELLDLIPSYAPNTITRRLYDLRQSGEVQVIDDQSSRAQDHVYQYMSAPLPDELPPLRMKDVFGKEKAGIPHDRDPATNFFAKLIQKVFS